MLRDFSRRYRCVVVGAADRARSAGWSYRVALLFAGAVGLAVAASSSASAQSFKVVDLGALAPSGAPSVAYTINDDEVVVGSTLIAGSNQAVAWTDVDTTPKLVILGPKGKNGAAYAVTGTGAIVGEINPSGVQIATRFGGTDVDLDPSATKNNVFSIAYNGNGNNTFVGMAGTTAEPNNPHATVFPATNLGSFGTDVSIAFDINGLNDVVGEAATASGPSRAFLHHGISGKLSLATDNLGTLGGLQSGASCVNNYEQVIGWSNLACPSGSPVSRIFLWEKGSMKNLGTPFALPGNIADPTGMPRHVQVVSLLQRLKDTSREGGECMNARTNAKGTPINPQTVGYAVLYYAPGNPRSANCVAAGLQSFTRAVAYDGTKMVDLNTLIPAKSGWYLEKAFGINTAAQIVGQGRIKGQLHAFVLIPTKAW
jgi:probable HAF family extracellular repeat protein